MKWCYGIVTVPQRIETTFPTTLECLRRAGFHKPRLFVDGAQTPCEYEHFGLEVSVRWPRIKMGGNHILALWELLLRDSQADRYALFEDDFVTYHNLRQYLEKVAYPERGYWNLYTFPENHQKAKGKHGFFPSNQLGKGAVALVFSREILTELLSAKSFVKSPQGHMSCKSIDGVIVQALSINGDIKEFCHNPSLVQHIGHDSTQGKRQYPQAPRFMGTNFDALELLKERQNENSDADRLFSKET